jgi:3-oxoacyl-[acyl-carrier protein] reductase
LGKEIAFSLGQAGAQVVFNYCNNDELAESVFNEYQSLGYSGMLLKADATDEDEVNRMIEEIEQSLGSVDILVLNATGTQPIRPIEQYEWENYQVMLDYFLKSPFYLTKAVLGKMKEKKWGRIISLSSEVVQNSTPNFSAYVAAKGAQTEWSKSMAKELAPFGITVNLVSPGWIPTERHANDPQEIKDEYLKTVPMGRWGIPNDIANAVLYFASEESSFASGQTLCVNGAKNML